MTDVACFESSVPERCAIIWSAGILARINYSVMAHDYDRRPAFIANLSFRPGRLGVILCEQRYEARKNCRADNEPSQCLLAVSERAGSGGHHDRVLSQTHRAVQTQFGTHSQR